MEEKRCEIKWAESKSSNGNPERERERGGSKMKREEKAVGGHNRWKILRMGLSGYIAETQKSVISGRSLPLSTTQFARFLAQFGAFLQVLD